MLNFIVISLSLYVPQTAWIRHLMKQHSQILGDDWKVDDYEQISVPDEEFKYPAYFSKPLHGFQQGGLCKYQALYQAPSMRYIMRLFQGNPSYRETEMVIEFNKIKQHLPKRALVVDIGCGSGDSTLAVSSALRDATVIGIDLSPYMVELAKLRTSLNFMHLDAAHLDGIEDNSIDAITSFALFHEMPHRYSLKVLRECRRVLKPGGHVLIWDQKITEQSTTSQTCPGVPAIEPFLKSYAELDIFEWLMSNSFTCVYQTDDKLMRYWYGQKKIDILSKY